MNLLSAIGFLLLSSNISAASGSAIRGGLPDEERKLGLRNGNGNKLFDETQLQDEIERLEAENDALEARVSDLEVISNFRQGASIGNDEAGGRQGTKPGNPVGTYDCDEGCDVSRGTPVCGVDGNTYFNECLATCQDIDIERNGSCPSDPPMNMASFAREGKVTKAEINAFKKEKFKLVAKRNPQYGVLPDARGEKEDGDPPSDNGNQSVLRFAKASRITAEGLEYVAEYNMDEIPEGVDYDASEGDIPKTDGEAPAPDGFFNRFLTVFGFDTRLQRNGYSWPNWRLGELDYWEGWWIFGSYQGRCSATIIDTNKVLTNAHCVYDRSNQAWKVPDRVAPGRSGSSDPWGTWDVSYATIFTIYKTTSDGTRHEYDMSVLTMKSNNLGHIGSYMGYLGMATQPCSFTESQWEFTGYPGDKPDGTMWNTGVCDDWSYSCGNRKIYHKCDTYGGMSGSGIRDGSDRVVGVHAFSGSTWNGGTAMTSWHLTNIENW